MTEYHPIENSNQMRDDAGRFIHTGDVYKVTNRDSGETAVCMANVAAAAPYRTINFFRVNELTRVVTSQTPITKIEENMETGEIIQSLPFISHIYKSEAGRGGGRRHRRTKKRILRK
jgi:hypothetical protein